MNINNLSDNQINYLCAVAQGWRDDGYSAWEDSSGKCMVCYISKYKPLTNDAQAMALQKEFYVEIIEGFPKKQGVQRRARVPYQHDANWQYASTDNRAICLAVIASKFGEEIDESLLEGVE